MLKGRLGPPQSQVVKLSWPQVLVGLVFSPLIGPMLHWSCHHFGSQCNSFNLVCFMLRLCLFVALVATCLLLFSKQSFSQIDSLSPQQLRNSWGESQKEIVGNPWTEGMANERSLFSIDELKQIFSFVRSELATDYSIRFRFSLKENGTELVEERRFARSSGKILKTRKPINGGVAEVRESYDGSVVRRCEITGLKSVAEISGVFDHAAFLDTAGDIVIRSMLLDLSETYNTRLPLNDIKVFLEDGEELIWVGGKLEEIGGRQCFSISQPNFDLWVCPEINYAICKISIFEFEGIKPVELSSVDFSDFREVKPGLYLPYRMDAIDHRRNCTEVVEVHEYLPDYELEISEVESIFPEGTVVRDRVNRIVSLADRESSVEEMLDFSISALKGLGSELVPKEEGVAHNPLRFKEACGPVSCYASLNWLMPGRYTLDSIANELGWSEGQKVPFVSVYNYLEKQNGIESMLIRVSPEELANILSEGGGAAVLPISKGSGDIDHSVCVVAGDNESVTLIDYPDLAKSMSLSELSRIWNGEAIVLSKLDAASTPWRLFSKKVILWTVIVSVCAGLFFFLKERRYV